MGVGPLLGMVGDFRGLDRLFIRDWKWGCSNPIISRITSMPHEPRAPGLDNQPSNANRAAHVSPLPDNVSHASHGCCFAALSCRLRWAVGVRGFFPLTCTWLSGRQVLQDP